MAAVRQAERLEAEDREHARHHIEDEAAEDGECEGGERGGKARLMLVVSGGGERRARRRNFARACGEAGAEMAAVGAVEAQHAAYRARIGIGARRGFDDERVAAAAHRLRGIVIEDAVGFGEEIGAADVARAGGIDREAELAIRMGVARGPVDRAGQSGARLFEAGLCRGVRRAVSDREVEREVGTFGDAEFIVADEVVDAHGHGEWRAGGKLRHGKVDEQRRFAFEHIVHDARDRKRRGHRIADR